MPTPYLGHQYYEKRLDFDDYVNKNMKITKKIVNDDFFVQYGINKRKQLGMDLRRAKAGVDLQSLVPKDVKCVFFERCEGTVMPKLPDSVEVLYIKKCNFKKFYFPKGLKELYFEYLPEMKTLPDLSNLKNLWSVDLLHMFLLSLPKNFPDSLMMLTMAGDRKVRSSLRGLPKNLEYILIKECDKILKIPDLSYLSKLRQISLYYSYDYPLVISKKIESKLVRLTGGIESQKANRERFT